MYIVHSVTQLYAISFFWRCRLGHLNNVSRDEDNILDQIYIKQICSDFYYEDLKFWEWVKKMHILRNTALYEKEVIKLGFSDNSMLVCDFV